MGTDKHNEFKYADRKYCRCSKCRNGSVVKSNYFPKMGVKMTSEKAMRKKAVNMATKVYFTAASCYKKRFNAIKNPSPAIRVIGSKVTICFENEEEITQEYIDRMINTIENNPINDKTIFVNVKYDYYMPLDMKGSADIGN